MVGLTTKFELIDSVEIMKGLDELTPAGRSAALAEFATIEIAAADTRNSRAYGTKIPHRTFVDGRESENFTSVRPDGSIVAVWEFGEEIVRWCYKALRDKAPVLKGEYRDSITIFADEVAVAGPEQVHDAEQVVIMATVPYARKLEGVAGPKYMSSQAPDGIFQVIAAMAKRRFGNQARIVYTFRNIAGMTSSLEGWASRRARKDAARFGSAKARREYQKNTRNPAILIMFK